MKLKGRYSIGMNNTQAKSIHAARIGDRIKASDGFSERFGKVYGIVTDRWGTHLRVKFEDFTFGTCPSFTTVGIGWYWLGRR